MSFVSNSIKLKLFDYQAVLTGLANE